MKSLTYLEVESKKKYGAQIKPNYVNSEALAIFNALEFSDNLEMGYIKVEFEVDSSKQIYYQIFLSFNILIIIQNYYFIFRFRDFIIQKVFINKITHRK